MQKRHLDRKHYFNEQTITTHKYVIPYIEKIMGINNNVRVLEIGCAEGGNLIPFLDKGCEVVGVDINGSQLSNARTFIEEERAGSNLKLIHSDIYKISNEEIGIFDLIMMRDVIEHIHNQEEFLNFVKQFLKPDGMIFLGFPPWFMPFGGHQQICRSRILSNLPYFHIFPKSIYKSILKLFGESNNGIKDLLEIKQTGLSIEKFIKIINTENFNIEALDFYFINPNYEVKFGLKPKHLWSLLSATPVVRNFLTTCCYCILSKNHEVPIAAKNTT